MSWNFKKSFSSHVIVLKTSTHWNPHSFLKHCAGSAAWNDHVAFLLALQHLRPGMRSWRSRTWWSYPGSTLDHPSPQGPYEDAVWPHWTLQNCLPEHPDLYFYTTIRLLHCPTTWDPQWSTAFGYDQGETSDSGCAASEMFSLSKTIVFS